MSADADTKTIHHEGDVPLVSIITPSYNQAIYIARTLESVRSQDYPRVEHIVVDGGSTDGTQQILQEQSFASWTSAPDRGQSHALNQGFARAQGQIVAWLNSDDMYTPGAIWRAVRALQKRPQAPFVFGAWDIVDESDHLLEHKTAPRSTIAKLIDPPTGILPGDGIGQPTVFMCANALRRVGGIDERLHMAMDYDLWVRLVREGEPTIVEETQALFRVSSIGKTSFFPPAMWAESFAVIARYGDARRAHQILLPLYYYAIRHNDDLDGTRRALLVAVERMQAPEQTLLDPRIVLGYTQWSQAAQAALHGNLARACSYAAAALHTGALRGPELALVARGILIVIAIWRDRLTSRRTPFETFLRSNAAEPIRSSGKQ